MHESWPLFFHYFDRCRPIFEFRIILTDELPIPRFRVNLLYSPVIQAPNRVVLDLEVVAANFAYYSETGTYRFISAFAIQQSPQFIGYAHMPTGVTLHWLCPIACQPIKVGHYGQAAALVANERTAGSRKSYVLYCSYLR